MDKNIPAIVGALSGEYSELAIMNFAMEYYSMYERFCDFSVSYIEGGREIMDAIVGASENLISKEKSDEEMIALLSEIRKKNMSEMETTTAYSDVLAIHENIMCRCEYRFKEDIQDIDDDEEARKLLGFIFNTKDNMQINLRIKDMVAQLPVRMTSSRFFDLVKDSITVYKGSEKSSLDGYMYLLYSAAGINEKKPFDLPELDEVKERFEQVDYKNMTKEEFEEYDALLQKATDYLEQRAAFILDAQKLINCLYTYYLVQKYHDGECEALKLVSDVIGMVNTAFRNELGNPGSFDELDIDIVDECFSKIEGRPEKYIEKTAASEGRFENAAENVRNIDAKVCDDMLFAMKLMSTSDFVDAEENDTTECDDLIINAAIDSYIGSLNTLFEGKQKQVKRAIMASVLKELPVFFASHNEVMNYVRLSLDNCRDKAEKAASLKLLWGIYE